MKIVPFENTYFSDDEVYFDGVTMKYYQNHDCTEPDDECQVLEITSRNNGVGRFINIKTENWSIDDPMEFVEIIKDFCKRADIDLEKQN